MYNVFQGVGAGTLTLDLNQIQLDAYTIANVTGETEIAQINSATSKQLKNVIVECFRFDPSKRPSASKVHSQLRDIFNLLNNLDA